MGNGSVFLAHQGEKTVKNSDSETIGVEIHFVYTFSNEKEVAELMKLLEVFVNENNKGLTSKKLEMRKWY